VRDDQMVQATLLERVKRLVIPCDPDRKKFREILERNREESERLRAASELYAKIRGVGHE